MCNRFLTMGPMIACNTRVQNNARHLNKILMTEQFCRLQLVLHSTIAPYYHDHGNIMVAPPFHTNCYVLCNSRQPVVYSVEGVVKQGATMIMPLSYRSCTEKYDSKLYQCVKMLPSFSAYLHGMLHTQQNYYYSYGKVAFQQPHSTSKAGSVGTTSPVKNP